MLFIFLTVFRLGRYPHFQSTIIQVYYLEGDRAWDGIPLLAIKLAFQHRIGVARQTGQSHYIT
jgi:hypothetical protein